jgi:homopolymeric O-antigen transport system ATP-binding protein
VDYGGFAGRSHTSRTIFDLHEADAVSEILLRVEKLGKCYRLGAPSSLTKKARALVRRWIGSGRYEQQQELWALRDISFEVERGQIVGIIGRNGAGKSTLLKILSRITRPSTGRIEYQGRVSSLLEIGAGFHPDLTGRENIFLNGAILGMARQEILHKLDEMVAFAEVEAFLDTPIKHYSSGMYLRLAFAVAAHLEPDILVIDEVLAVGDAGFQRKCLTKMSAAAGSGRTVLFVSHHLPTVMSLCDRCLLLQEGRLVASGPTADVARVYQKSLHAGSGAATDLGNAPRTGNGKGRFVCIRAYSRGPGGEEIPYLVSGHDLWIDVAIEAQQSIRDANVAVILYAPTGERVIDVNLLQHGRQLNLAPFEAARVGFHLRDVLLKPDVYAIGLWLGRAHIEDIDHVVSACSVTVEANPGIDYGIRRFPGYYQCRYSENVEIHTSPGVKSEENVEHRSPALHP